MTSYSDWTKQMGDQWVAALKQAETVVSRFSGSMQAGRDQLNIPEMPEPMSRFADAISDRVPNPTEVVQANFELTQRLLEAQRELTLHVLEASTAAYSGQTGGKKASAGDKGKGGKAGS